MYKDKPFFGGGGGGRDEKCNRTDLKQEHMRLRPIFKLQTQGCNFLSVRKNLNKNT